MRQIFTSPRLENVQSVETLLNEAGIATRMTDASTWNRATKRDFSYTDRSGSYRWPALWVLNAGDYSRARELLRESGVAVPTTRGTEAPSYAPRAKPDSAASSGLSAATKFRLLLVAAVVITALVQGLRHLGVLPF